MRVKICENELCRREYRRSGRPEQRFCSHECFRVATYKMHERPTSRRCERCDEYFEIGRRKEKRFCSQRCVALARESLARLRRMKDPQPPRVRRKPGRIEWMTSGKHLGRGMASAPAKMDSEMPRSPWHQMLLRVGYRSSS